MNLAHTPVPWVAIQNDHYWEIQSEDGQVGDCCASKFMSSGKDVGAANAEFIVRAVNNFDSLVAALARAGSYLEHDERVPELRAMIDAALAKADGRT